MQEVPFQSGSCPDLTPSQIQNAYGFNLLYSEGINGTGESVAIVVTQGDAQILSDIQGFDQAYNLPRLVNGSNLIIIAPFGSAPATSEDWTAETALDVEVIHSLAPGAKIYLMVAPNDSWLFNTINYTINNLQVSSISLSWGVSEEQYNSVLINQENSILAKATQKRIEIFAATGDDGAFNGLSQLNVNFPASSPYVIATGGTVLSVSPGGTYLGETAWNGSGGGYSQFFSKPAPQPNISSQRMIPDVSFNAGAPICAFINSQWSGYTGTSIAAPAWAAIDTLVNEKASGSGALSMKTIYDSYYSKGSLVFNQIYGGNNNQYSANGGYNLVAGLGSPKTYQLVQVLSSQSYEIEFNSSSAAAIFNIDGVNYTGPTRLNFSYGQNVALKAYSAVQTKTSRYRLSYYSGFVNSDEQPVTFSVNSSGFITANFNLQFAVFEKSVNGSQNRTVFIDNGSSLQISSPIRTSFGNTSYTLVGLRVGNGATLYKSSESLFISAPLNLTFVWDMGSITKFSFSNAPSGAAVAVSYIDYIPFSNKTTGYVADVSSGENVSVADGTIINYSSIPLYYNSFRFVTQSSTLYERTSVNLNFIQESKYILTFLSKEGVKIYPTTVYVSSPSIIEEFPNSTIWAPTGEDFDLHGVSFVNNGFNVLPSPMLLSPQNATDNISLPVDNVAISVGLYLGIPVIAAKVDFIYKNLSITNSTSISGLVTFYNVPDNNYNLSINAYGSSYNYQNLNGNDQSLQITPFLYQLYLIIGSISIIILALAIFEVLRHRSKKFRSSRR
jgi:hypothetical protein